MLVTLRNSFHSTSARVRVSALPAILTPRHSAELTRKLCPSRECTCGAIRGPQSVEVELHLDGRMRLSAIAAE